MIQDFVYCSSGSTLFKIAFDLCLCCYFSWCLGVHSFLMGASSTFTCLGNHLYLARNVPTAPPLFIVGFSNSVFCSRSSAWHELSYFLNGQSDKEGFVYGQHRQGPWKSSYRYALYTFFLEKPTWNCRSGILNPQRLFFSEHESIFLRAGASFGFDVLLQLLLTGVFVNNAVGSISWPLQ